MTNPYPEGSGEHLLFAIFGELPGPDACECGMPTECKPSPTAAELCQNCQRAIEPVDAPGAQYGHRHGESKRICCRSVYEPEIATPASQPERTN